MSPLRGRQRPTALVFAANYGVSLLPPGARSTQWRPEPKVGSKRQEAEENIAGAPADVSLSFRHFRCDSTWIVDADGIVRAKILAFSGSEKWEEWMADLIETTGPGAGTAGAAPEAKTDR